MMRFLFLALSLALFLPSGAGAENLRGLLDQSRGEVDAAVRQNAAEAARQAAARAERDRLREQQRDRSRDFCYSLPMGSDAEKACRGEFVVTIQNDRARNILQGYCGALGASTELNRDLSYICDTGVKGCPLLDNSDAAHWCTQCGGTRNWLATYSLGYMIKCFR